MNRELNNSVSVQLGKSADFVAESGINRAINYIKTPANQNVNFNNCDDGISTVFSGGSDVLSTTDPLVKYTCLLIDSHPPELTYSSLPADKSKIIKLQPESGSFGSLLFSWTNSGIGYPPSGMQLLDFASWNSNNYRTLLRVTLYPMGADGALNASNAKTFFLRPTAGGAKSLNFTTKANQINDVECKAGVNAACNVVIDGLPGLPTVSYYYARVTPLYQDVSRLTISALDGTNTSTARFLGGQATIDLTAQKNDAVKRYKAQVTFNIGVPDDAFPEYALRSASTVCKRYVVRLSDVITEPGTTSGYCQDYQPCVAEAPPAIGASSVTPAPTAGLTLQIKVTVFTSALFRKISSSDSMSAYKNVITSWTGCPVDKINGGSLNWDCWPILNFSAKRSDGSIITRKGQALSLHIYETRWNNPEDFSFRSLSSPTSATSSRVFRPLNTPGQPINVFQDGVYDSAASSAAGTGTCQPLTTPANRTSDGNLYTPQSWPYETCGIFIFRFNISNGSLYNNPIASVSQLVDPQGALMIDMENDALGDGSNAGVPVHIDNDITVNSVYLGSTWLDLAKGIKLYACGGNCFVPIPSYNTCPTQFEDANWITWIRLNTAVNGLGWGGY